LGGGKRTGVVCPVGKKSNTQTKFKRKSSVEPAGTGEERPSFAGSDLHVKAKGCTAVDPAWHQAGAGNKEMAQTHESGGKIEGVKVLVLHPGKKTRERNRREEIKSGAGQKGG